MTDPIIQDPAQQVVQTTIQTNEPQIEFDLNLPTNTEPQIINEEPVVSLDFSDIGQAIQDNSTQAVNTQSEINEETPIIFSEVPVEQPVIENSIEPVQESIQEIITTPVIEEIQDTPAEQPVIEQIVEPVQEPIQEIITTPVIEEIQDTPAEQPVIEETPIIFNEVPITETDITEPTTEISQEQMAPELEIAKQYATGIVTQDNEINKENQDTNEYPTSQVENSVFGVTPNINNTENTTTINEEPTKTSENIITQEILVPEEQIADEQESIINEDKQTDSIQQDNINQENESITIENNNEKNSIQQPNGDNWLEQEDSLVEANIASEDISATPQQNDIKEIPEIKNESLNIFETSEEKLETTAEIKEQAPEIKEQAPETPAPIQAVEQNIIAQEPIQLQQNLPPSSNLQQDQAIIQQLQQSAGNQSVTPIQTTTPTATEVNLDDILSSPTPATTNTTSPAGVVAPQQNNGQSLPAFSGLQGYTMPTMAPQIAQPTKPAMNKKIMINFLVGIAVFVIGGFMFKTMYPLEYQKMLGKNQTQTINNELTTTVTPPVPEESGAISDNGLFDNPSLSGYHGAAQESDIDGSGAQQDFNAFEDLEKSLGENDKVTKEKLQNYIDQGKKYLVVAKKTNDKTMTKYSLFLYKKASALLLDIENGEQISTDERDTQLADFESYLQKLTGTGTNDQTTTTTEPTKPTPEEFFGSENSGAKEESTSATEIPSSTTNSGTATNTQETQNANENISGNQDTIN